MACPSILISPSSWNVPSTLLTITRPGQRRNWTWGICPPSDGSRRAALRTNRRVRQTRLIGAGRVALGQACAAEALEYFRQALAAQHRNAATTAGAIVYSAEALMRKHELARPAELCGFLLGWPGTPYHVKRAAEKLLAEVETRLPAEHLAAALKRGKEQPLIEIVAHV